MHASCSYSGALICAPSVLLPAHVLLSWGRCGRDLLGTRVSPRVASIATLANLLRLKRLVARLKEEAGDLEVLEFKATLLGIA